MRLNNKSTNIDKINHTYISILKEFVTLINESKHCDNPNNLVITMFIGMNTIHRVFEYILIKTKNIEKVCYYCKKTYYYYLEYMEQIHSSNLHQNLNHMDAMLFVYKKTIFDLYDGENEDTFGTMTNIIASNGEIMNIDDNKLQEIMKIISKIMNTLFYWENAKFSFYERRELCNYLDLFMIKCFSIKHIVPFLEILQKKITMKYLEYILLLKELIELNDKKIKNYCDIDINEWTLNKFYIQKNDFEDKINENNIKGLIKWGFYKYN
uniref:Uncharacterized protein n=1 Tax=viral metagenome TaxID=1070528 RepID=A0A6C0DBT7_9ZZZZ